MENPRIQPSFIEELRRAKGPDFVRQEFDCQFVENGRSLVSQEDVDGLPLVVSTILNQRTSR
jgi:hypothetical protein